MRATHASTHHTTASCVPIPPPTPLDLKQDGPRFAPHLSNATVYRDYRLASGRQNRDFPVRGLRLRRRRRHIVRHASRVLVWRNLVHGSQAHSHGPSGTEIFFISWHREQLHQPPRNRNCVEAASELAAVRAPTTRVKHGRGA